MLYLHLSLLCVTACNVQVRMLHSFDYTLVYTCVLLALQGSHTHEHSISPVPAPLQHFKSGMTSMIAEEEEEEEEESLSPAEKIRKLQNDEEEVCEDML